jgi:hypothetical protein
LAPPAPASPTQPRQGELATELPAAVLARTLGIEITVAVTVKWQRAAAGDWGVYVAEVSRRTSRHGQEIASANRQRTHKTTEGP